MKTFFLLISFMVLAVSCTRQPKAPTWVGEVRVLSYSSMGSESGFLKSIREEFQKQTQCELKIETTLGAAQIVSFLKEHPGQTDFVVGIDELMFERGKEFWDTDGKVMEWMKNVKWNRAVVAQTKPGFFPLDYGALTFIYNKKKLSELKLEPMKSVEEILKPAFKKKFIVQDPRVSSPGLHFFAWLPKSVPVAKLKSQWLSLAQSWDSSYQMFLQGEAPMVWSYLSSMAYHESKGQADQYGFIDFKEGLPVHVEGMAKVKSPSSNCSQKWVEFLYAPSIQSKLVEKQWMLPVVQDVPLPKSFQEISKFSHFNTVQPTLSEVDALLSSFGKSLQGDSW